MPRFQNTLLKAASCEDASLSPEVFLLLAGENVGSGEAGAVGF